MLFTSKVINAEYRLRNMFVTNVMALRYCNQQNLVIASTI